MVRLIKLSTAKMPEFKEVRGKDWIQYGEKNVYPDYLLDLYYSSPYHQAVVEGKAFYVAGKGFSNNIQANRYQKINELLQEASIPFELYDGVAFEIIYSLGGGREVYHIDFNKIRSNDDGSEYYYSDNWKTDRQSLEDTGFKTYKPFDPANKTGVQLLYYFIRKPRKSGEINCYPVPNYIAAIPSIEVDSEICKYDRKVVKTGFTAGTMINFSNGIPTEEEQEDIEKKLKKKFTGNEDDSDSIILNFSDGKDHGAEIIQINGNDLDKRFIETEKRCQQKIFTVHKVTSPMLFGIKTEGQLGGRTELIEAYELFSNTYINDRQQKLEMIFQLLFGTEIGKIIPTEPIGMPAEEQQEPVQPSATFSFDKVERARQKALKILLSDEIGRPMEDYEIVQAKRYFDSDDVMEFASELSSVERSVLDLLKKDPLMPATEIAKVIKKTPERVEKIIKKLTKNEYVKEGTKKSGEDKIPKLTVTDKGNNVITDEPAKTINVEVLYSYEVVPGKGAPIIPTTRDFCREIIAANKLYTRKEIERISAEVGYNVWEMRGGWYTDPKRKVHLPYCRHEWRQNIVVEK